MIEPQYEAYFNDRVRPFLDGRQIEYLGLLSQTELAPLYRKAAAVLFLMARETPGLRGRMPFS